MFLDDGCDHSKISTYIVLSSGECLASSASGPREVEAKPGTGVEIADNDESRAELAERLRGLESDGDYVAVFVWPDSFPQFRLLKEFLVGRKFEYRLVPMTPGEKVYMGGQATSKPRVQ